MKKAARIGAIVVAVWLAFLLVAGLVYSGRAKQRVAERVGGSMLATATVETAELALIRGYMELAGLHVVKNDVGQLTLDVGTVRSELWPLGAALVDHHCRELIVRNVRLDVSSAAVIQLSRPKRVPLHVDRLEVYDAHLAFSPSAFVPELGTIAIAVDYVDAGPTTLNTPLSWIFSMRALTATLDLPAGIRVYLAYTNGELTVTGSIFGSQPVTIPVRLPVASDTDDAKAELGKLVGLGKALAEQLAVRRAKDWLRSTLTF